MRKVSKEYKLSTTDLKILETVSFLNQKGIYPVNEGVYKILKGDEDLDLDIAKEVPTYKTLVSFPSKKISNLIMMLLRHNYLEKIYDIPTDEMYLKVSGKGETSLLTYHKKHKYKFKEKKVKEKPLFLIKK